jgi:hypothetical protein
MSSASPFRETETDSTLCIEWDNRTVRKDGCLFSFFIFFWLIWAPATVLVTWLVFVEEGGTRLFLAIWLIGGWFGTLAIPYTLLGRSWREWIEVSEDTICHGREGFLAPTTKSFALSTILCIFFGRCGEESTFTLSIYCAPGYGHRHMFGYWLAPDLKRQLFERIEAFVRDKELSLEMNKGYRNLA